MGTEINIDVIVILDDSGSMATCWPWPQEGPPYGPPCEGVSYNAPSDPNELRYSAARLLIHLADGADRIAVLRFDNRAEGVGALGLLQEVGGAENRRRLAASLQPPTDYALRGFTRLDLGLEEALNLLNVSRDPNRSQYVLLLTDGEPTAPIAIADQEEMITDLLEQIQAAGALVYPVILCNADAGCPDYFLKNSLPRAREAKSSQDILRIFSEVFAEMKSDRSVVTQRNLRGDLTISIREAHGVGSMAFVSPRAAITSVQRDGAPMLTRSILADGNVDLNVAVEPLPAGAWVAKTTDLSSFAVVQADSYPELLFPPPSVQDNPASTRYYPTGKAPLVVVRGAGPAADEPLLLDGATPIPSLGQAGLSYAPLWGALPGGGEDISRATVGRNMGALQLSGSPEEVTIQLGEDERPLQLRRTFQLQARDDLPRAQVFSPSVNDIGILSDGSLQLQIGFGPGALLREVQATVYVTDMTADADGGGRAVYQKALNCQDQICSDNGFMPVDGRSYQALFLLTAVVDGVRFGDFAQTPLDVAPSVYLRGLPAEIDLAKMPYGGWPLTVQAGTVEEIGSLEGSLTLRRADTGKVVREVALNFSVDVPESGSQMALLHVDGLDSLRPGEYEGELDLSAFGPAGLPMEVQIRPAPSLPVAINVPRSVARIQAQEADFGELPFDTSPNFRLNEEILLPVVYSADSPFRLTVELIESSCSDLAATAGDLQPHGDGWALPVRLQSQGLMLPGGCHGSLRLTGPSQDFDVFPETVPYRVQIRGVEWSVAGALDFGDLGRAGEQSTQTLLLRFDGKRPFVVEVEEIAAYGETGQDAVTVDDRFLEAPAVEIDELPDANGFYKVPITLVARKALPKDPLRGSFYSGDLVLGIAGLPHEVRSVDVSFRSPTLYQRYVEWWLRPFYTFPLFLCTAPLSLLLLLIAVARIRSRGYNIDDAEEPDVTLPGQAFPLTPESGIAFVRSDFEDSADRTARGTAAQDVSWDAIWSQGGWGAEPSSAERANDTELADNTWSNTAKDEDTGDPWADQRG